ncbi:hybrid sensor histidine kinase/response regulator [Thalassospira marina]|uniref:histidine kinase n=1 Tax=Thalassospira marina TaxID=2048283 RepID=A0A2N3KYJ2_9PROT|nr:NahK/ErcS family hybrid sensor histidine kinase/response regulator [Thalassospira marina]PKR55608.1 hybrid sensor histidine kinase/response regulator [Thalassospira marina]
MLQGGLIFIVAMTYIGLLFAIAHYGDKYARLWRMSRLKPVIYALSMAVYCTSWTFFGSVGTASLHGFAFLPIYIGPLVMMLAGYPVMVKIATVCRAQNITSIADFLGSRYGKSQSLAALVAVIAMVGILAYIALQLKAVSTSFDVLLGPLGEDIVRHSAANFTKDTAFYVTILMAVFGVLFGVRYIHASEHHDGLILAIAFESTVKLVALLAVGLFVVFGLFGGMNDLASQASARPDITALFAPENWLTPHFFVGSLIGMFAIICLPRQFHVTFVENDDSRNLKTARWLFPAYLVAINLFVVPIAVAGLLLFDGQAAVNPDTFVLTLPLLGGQNGLALIAFVGGLSASTGMVIVSCVAVSTMVCNDLVMPVLLRLPRLRDQANGDVSQLVLKIRRIAVLVLMFLAYGFYRFLSEKYALADIGMLSFAAVAQFAPALLAALYIKAVNRTGVRWGLIGGFGLWCYTLLLPSFVQSGFLPHELLANGPLGIAFLKPQALFGLHLDPLTHGVIWSLGVNVILLLLGSATGIQGVTQRRQAQLFVDVGRNPAQSRNDIWPGRVTIGELESLAARFLGAQWAERAFRNYLAKRGGDVGRGDLADIDASNFTEHLLSGAVGAASSRVVMALLLPDKAVSRRDAMELLDEASEAIKFNRDLLLNTLENISQGVGVFDQDLRLATWNHRFIDLLGIAAADIQVTMPLAQLVETCRHTGPRSVDLDILVGRNAAPQMRRLPHTYERKRSDGMVLEIRTNPMPDGGFVATIADITARVRTEDALRESERNIRIYTDNIPVMIAYADKNQRLRFTNRPYERMFGLRRAAAHGLTVAEAVGETRYKRLAPMIAEVLKGYRQSFEIDFPPMEGFTEERFAEGTYIPHFDETGEVLGYFCIYHDITERRLAEQALKEANESLEQRVIDRTHALETLNSELSIAKEQAETANDTKTRFFAAASHDLLQPLNAARLFTVALGGRELADDAADLVGKVDVSLKGVEELLNELLDICKLDAGAMQPSLQDFPISRVLNVLKTEFTPIAEQAGLRFHVHSRDIWVRSDSRLLRRILQNFISNALRYTRKGGTVVGCRLRGDVLRIEVWDSGPGIPEDKLKIIFREFHRLESPENVDVKGLGLGLAIVDRLGRRLEHPVSVRSRPGHGTVFSVDVPLGIAAPETIVTTPRRRLGGELGGLRVLCIDNEPDILAGMRAMLENWDCVVATARSGEEAVSLLCPPDKPAPAFMPDIILADYHLSSGQTGLDVLRRLRDERGLTIPGIIITADRSPETAEKISTQSFGLLNKPLKPAKLRALMTRSFVHQG